MGISQRRDDFGRMGNARNFNDGNGIGFGGFQDGRNRNRFGPGFEGGGCKYDREPSFVIGGSSAPFGRGGGFSSRKGNESFSGRGDGGSDSFYDQPRSYEQFGR